jgi:hypothetical protein
MRPDRGGAAVHSRDARVRDRRRRLPQLAITISRGEKVVARQRSIIVLRPLEPRIVPLK